MDPPYNTGTDGFVYPDNFKFNSKELSAKIGISEEEANRIIDLAGKSTHSAWLTFMYPRLLLARDLLENEGIIFISIDDNEQANLRLICDEIFGEENFVGCFSRATGTTTGQDANKVGSSLDYCLAYSKTNLFDLGGIPLSEQDSKRFNKIDEKGSYSILQLRKTGNEDRKEDRETMFFPIEAPDGSEVYPFGPENYLSRWRMSNDSYLELVEKEMIHWEYKERPELIVDGYKRSNWTPYVKYYLEGRTKQISNLLIGTEGNKKASIHLKNLFGAKDVFTNPKPIEFIEILLQISQSENSIVLDFFSGSSTTAEAVLKLNAEKNSHIKYIMVQLPEQIDENKPAYKLGYKTIDEVGSARIEKAAKKN
ncbi:site-specific DNA-methyltransferase [Aerococcus urinaehominis]|uniref:site-specific DNA-methyltransferase n=1 Tax=Aerococcus urinaehominis TaxID=128944 RepID=UPI001F41ACEC|nr:site-specific DNA-methyltransferase [Aerococcus urinaehominis]